MPDRRFNVVLICVDQWRGDCLGSLGHPVVRTPFLDGLASEGATFRRAYSATPTCVPARAALHTGLSQTSHGRVGYEDGVPWTYRTTLAGTFGSHGYQTHAVGKMHVFPERNRLGFDDVVLHDGYLHHARARHRDPLAYDDYVPWLRERLGREADDFDHGVNCNSYVARPWDKPEDTHPSTFVTTKGIEFLGRRDPTRPFFLFLSFHRPHPPYDPPAWAFESYLEEPMPEPPRGDWIGDLARYMEPHRPDAKVDRVSRGTLQRARAGYYGHMTHIDHQVNRFLETLRAYGEADDTIIAFVSDHGEMLGDHDMFRKAYPYEGSARIPFLLAGPGIPAGVSSDAVVELRDVMPTLLDGAGLPVPESVEGHSLLSVARADVEAVRPYLHGEHVVFDGSMQWLTDGHEKYVWFSTRGEEQLFDLRSDPAEEHDLARRDAHRDRVKAWREILIRELAGRPEGYSTGTQLVPGRTPRAVL